LCASLWIGTASAQSYTQTNVDSNVAGAANRFDPQLVEPYGLSRGSSMAWWVSDAGSGVSTLYAGDGSKNPLVVTIPPARRLPPGTKGTPAGTIGNASPSDFLVAGQPAAFLFSSLDGAITAWAPSVGTTPGQTLSTQAELVAMGERGSIYPAIASGFIDGKRYLYAANLGLGRIDVYDSKFRAVRLPRGNPQPWAFDSDRLYPGNEPFVDNRLPSGYAPFNVQAIGNDIVVTYVLHPDSRSTTPIAGPSLGYVDIYSPSGVLLTRLEHNDAMDVPYGVSLAPLDFGAFSHALLVAQSGTDHGESAGTIAAYDIVTGKFEGRLKDTAGKTLVIPGLHGLAPGNSAPANFDAAASPPSSPGAELYYTAFTGQGAQAPSLFGFLTPVAADLIKGNDQ
jgi:uncharacterized protein (TIGR03118 family)